MLHLAARTGCVQRSHQRSAGAVLQSFNQTARAIYRLVLDAQLEDAELEGLDFKQLHLCALPPWWTPVCPQSRGALHDVYHALSLLLLPICSCWACCCVSCVCHARSKAREAFLLSDASAVRNVLTEFLDHEMLATRSVGHARTTWALLILASAVPGTHATAARV